MIAKVRLWGRTIGAVSLDDGAGCGGVSVRPGVCAQRHRAFAADDAAERARV